MHLAGPHVKADAAERDHTREALCYVAQLQHRLRATRRCRCAHATTTSRSAAYSGGTFANSWPIPRSRSRRASRDLSTPSVPGQTTSWGLSVGHYPDDRVSVGTVCSSFEIEVVMPVLPLS